MTEAQTAAPIVFVDPLFDDPADADTMVALARTFGRYRAYAEQEQIELEIGPGLAPRHDSVQNFLRQGGLSGADEPLDQLVHAHPYFREEYAYGARCSRRASSRSCTASVWSTPPARCTAVR